MNKKSIIVPQVDFCGNPRCRKPIESATAIVSFNADFSSSSIKKRDMLCPECSYEEIRIFSEQCSRGSQMPNMMKYQTAQLA